MLCPLRPKSRKHIDFVVVRENNEGLYNRFRWVRFQRDTVTKSRNPGKREHAAGVERCPATAFDYTRKRNKDKKLMLCGRPMCLTYAFDLWERAFHEIGQRIIRKLNVINARCGRNDDVVRQEPRVVSM